MRIFQKRLSAVNFLNAIKRINSKHYVLFVGMENEMIGRNLLAGFAGHTENSVLSKKTNPMLWKTELFVADFIEPDIWFVLGHNGKIIMYRG